MNNYKRLKSQVLIKCTQKVGFSNINQLKVHFENEINSTRRSSNIKSINELISVLEKRDILNEHDIRALKDIASVVNDQESLIAIDNYEKERRKNKNIVTNETLQPEQTTSSNNPTSSYSNAAESASGHVTSHRNDNKNLESNIKQESPVVQSGLSSCLIEILIEGSLLSMALFGVPLGTDRVDRCFDIISQEIGYSWKEFARGLGIREGEIDGIEEKHPNNIRNRCYEIYKIMERKKHPRRFRTDLEAALRKARRMDLAEQVAEIFDEY